MTSIKTLQTSDRLITDSSLARSILCSDFVDSEVVDLEFRRLLADIESVLNSPTYRFVRRDRFNRPRLWCASAAESSPQSDIVTLTALIRAAKRSVAGLDSSTYSRYSKRGSKIRGGRRLYGKLRSVRERSDDRPRNAPG